MLSQLTKSTLRAKPPLEIAHAYYCNLIHYIILFLYRCNIVYMVQMFDIMYLMINLTKTNMGMRGSHEIRRGLVLEYYPHDPLLHY